MIRAPLKSGKQVPNDPILLQHLLTFNWQLLSYRQTAEWGMCTLQGLFGHLHVPLPITSKTQHHCHIETCARLSNVCAHCVGINEIHSVYMPIWRASEDE
jgi:hypothetical protein